MIYMRYTSNPISDFQNTHSSYSLLIYHKNTSIDRKYGEY